MKAKSRAAARRKGERPEPGASKVISIGERRLRALEPGAHLGEIEARADGGYAVRLSAGAPVHVSLAPGVTDELAEEAMRERRPVVVAQGPEGPCLYGALQTKATRAAPQELVIEAGKRLVLRVGRARIELLADGTVRIAGQAATLDMPREIRMLTARAEIP